MYFPKLSEVYFKVNFQAGVIIALFCLSSQLEAH